jgi:hypothetical protein
MNAFYVWNPITISQDSKTLEFVVSNGDVDGISQDKKFIESILEEIGADIEVQDWSITPCRSGYYSEYLDEDDWRDAWLLVWKISVTASHEIKRVPDIKDLWKGVNSTGDDWLEVVDDDAVDCLIVSDFDDELSMKEAVQSVLNDNKMKSMRKKYSAEKPKISCAKVLNKYYQVQVDLGKFPASFFSGDPDYAKLILSLCQEKGGTVSFSTRE